jgi:glycosyltransferase involved in cell wall biosynthesis
LRILYFTRDYTTHDYRFLTSLAESGLEVFSLRLEKRHFRYEERPLPEKIRQVEWAGGGAPLLPAGMLNLLPDLKRVIKEIKPDLIHAGPIPSTAFLTALTGFKPLVSMSWGSDLLSEIDLNHNTLQSAKCALEGSSIMVCDCQAVQRRAEELGFPAEKTVIFPWGIDLDHFQPGDGSGLRRKLGWNDSHFMVLSTRSWEPIYRVDVTVRGFALASRNRPELRLLLLGGGSQDKIIRGLVDEYGLEDKVFFGGQVGQKDLPDYYRASDLYVSSSHSDGSSVSLMEALACGRPALVSDIPGNAEWIEPDRQGWLFRDGDECDLQGKLEAVLGDQGSLQAVSHAARELAEARADWKVNFQKLLYAYQLAVKK